MTAYYIFIGIVFVLAIMATSYSKNVFIESEGRYFKQANIIFVTIIFFALVFLYTFRWCNGTDFYNYYLDFQKMKYAKGDTLLENRDILFTLLTYYSYKIFDGNFIIYNFILGVLTYLPIVITIRKHSENFALSILLYIFMTLYFIPYNTVRQGIACGLCFLAFSYVYDKQYIKFFFIMLIAIAIHSSAMLFIPIVLLSNRDSHSKEIYIGVFILLIIFLGLGTFWNYIIKFLNLIGQSKMASDYKDALSEGNGISYLRVIVIFIPIILSYIYYNAIKSQNKSNKIDFIINLSLFGAIFMLFGLKFAILARISQYFEIYIVLLYPYILNAFTKEEKRLLTFTIVIVYFLYMSVLLNSGGNLVPYQYYYDYKGEWMIDIDLSR